jgi:dTDP-4-dehydrorhamnose reductase
MISGLRGEREVRLFVDEIRTPILANDIARQIWEMVRLGADRRSGVWNLAGPESVSRYTLGLMAAAAVRIDPTRLIPAYSAEAPGPRPRDLRLLVERANRELPTRARALSEAVAEAASKHVLVETRSDSTAASE